MNKHSSSQKHGQGRRDWRREQPEPPAQRINAYMLEDPMYEYMEEKKRKEKQERIDQLKALLESSTDSGRDSDSDGDNQKESKKSKKKKKQKQKKSSKRKDVSASDDEPQVKKKKKTKRKHTEDTSDIEWVEGSVILNKEDKRHQDVGSQHEIQPDAKADPAVEKRHSISSSKKSSSKHKKERKKKKKKSESKQR